MVESDIFPVLPFVVDVEQDVLVLDHCQIGEVDAGKGIVALGALLLSAGAGDDLSVKDDIYAVGPFTGANRRLSSRLVRASVTSRSMASVRR